MYHARHVNRKKEVVNVMFIPSYIPQNRIIAAFLYHTRKNIKIIRIELKHKLQQKQQQVKQHNGEEGPQKRAQRRIQLV